MSPTSTLEASAGPPKSVLGEQESWNSGPLWQLATRLMTGP